MTLKKVFSELDSVKQDNLVRVVCALQARGSPAQLETLNSRLLEIKAQLEEIEHKRNRVKDLRRDIREILDILKTGNSPDLLPLEIAFSKLYEELDEEIESSRPLELLTEKVKLRKEISRRKLASRLARVLSDTAGKK